MRFRAAAAADHAMRTTTSVDFDDDGEKVLTVARVTKILRTESKSHPTFYPSRRIKNDGKMRYSSDVYEFSGSKEQFTKVQSRFERRFFADLKDVESEIENVSSVDLNVFLVRWNATFVPAKLAWLQNVASNWPFGDVDIERKDILHKINALCDSPEPYVLKRLIDTLRVSEAEYKNNSDLPNEKIQKLNDLLRKQPKLPFGL